MPPTPSPLLGQLAALSGLIDSLRQRLSAKAPANPKAVEQASQQLQAAHVALQAAGSALAGPAPGVNTAVAMSHPVHKIAAVQRELNQRAEARSSRGQMMTPAEVQRVLNERDALIGSRTA